MSHGTVVLLGRLPFEPFVLDCIASEFGFSFRRVENIHDLADLDRNDDVAAVLFNPGILALPWEEALSLVLNSTPTALPIVCHGFANHIDWPKMADAGAFHLILVPFKMDEVRQSLGFVWEAKHRSSTMGPGKVSPGNGYQHALAVEIVA